MIRAMDCEYAGVDARGRHVVREQLYPESRGWVEHYFESEDAARRWIADLTPPA